MLRKLTLFTALAAAVLFPAAAAFAGARIGIGPERGHERYERGYERGEYRGEERRHERREGRHERHFYHGRWWNYGEGPCWRQVGPAWIWICG